MIYKLLDRFKEFPEVDSIIIAGSRASGNNDNLSDYDIYVYGKEPVPEEKRAGLLNMRTTVSLRTVHMWILFSVTWKCSVNSSI